MDRKPGEPCWAREHSPVRATGTVLVTAPEVPGVNPYILASQDELQIQQPRQDNLVHAWTVRVRQGNAWVTGILQWGATFCPLPAVYSQISLCFHYGDAKQKAPIIVRLRGQRA